MWDVTVVFNSFFLDIAKQPISANCVSLSIFIAKQPVSANCVSLSIVIAKQPVSANCEFYFYFEANHICCLQYLPCIKFFKVTSREIAPIGPRDLASTAIVSRRYQLILFSKINICLQFFNYYFITFLRQSWTAVKKLVELCGGPLGALAFVFGNGEGNYSSCSAKLGLRPWNAWVNCLKFRRGPSFVLFTFIL